MTKVAVLVSLGLLALGGRPARAQAAKPAYMQIFYEGAGWSAGRPLLHYSPALRGKISEVVPEPDSIRAIAPNMLALGMPQGELTATSVTETTATGSVTRVSGPDGRVHVQTPAEAQRARTQEQAQYTRYLNLLDARGTLARTTLTAALNTAATDGWEVVQVASWGGKDGLVYLLRRRP